MMMDEERRIVDFRDADWELELLGEVKDCVSAMSFKLRNTIQEKGEDK
jgi:hypothetical protein